MAAAAAIIVAIGAVVITVRMLGIDSAPVVTAVPDTTTTTLEQLPARLPDTVTPVTPDGFQPGDVPGSAEQAINEVGALAVDDGVLWSSTRAGIVRTDLETMTSELLPFGDDLPVAEETWSHIAVAPDGTVWVVAP
jgi:hypothetical protein